MAPRRRRHGNVVRPRAGKKRLPPASKYAVGRKGKTSKGKMVVVKSTKDGHRWKPMGKDKGKISGTEARELRRRLKRKFAQTGTPGDKKRRNKRTYSVHDPKHQKAMKNALRTGKFGRFDVRGVDTPGS